MLEIIQRMGTKWKVLSIGILLFAAMGCGGDKTTKAAINGLESGDLPLGFTDSIYSWTKGFPEKFQMSLAFVQGDRVEHYGILRENDTLLPIENQYGVFELGSISKVFNATLLANFVMDGELSLKDSINGHFGFPFNKGLDFTFEELANHSSGLPRLPSDFQTVALLNPGNPYRKYDNEKLEKYLREKVKLVYEKGEKSSYSNLGAGLIAQTLIRYSNTSYEELLQQQIFQKYGMGHSTTQREQVGEALVGGLDQDGDPTSNWDLGALLGAGGIYSNTSDLAKFAMAQFDSTNLELALTREKTIADSGNVDIGLGWYILDRGAGGKWYWHNGGTGGYSTSMAVDVDHQRAVIVLSNISSYHKDFGNIDRLCFSLMALLGKIPF